MTTFPYKVAVVSTNFKTYTEVTSEVQFRTLEQAIQWACRYNEEISWLCSEGQIMQDCSIYAQVLDGRY
jgi:hypothetical protein